MSILSASQYVSTVDGISIDGLLAEGVRLVLLDRDNTCVPRDSHIVPPQVAAWFARAKEAGLTLCLVSNNIHLDQVQKSASELGIEGVGCAMKPSPTAVRAAMKRFGAEKNETVFIGDQLFTDIASGNLAGVKTILVRPQSQVDLWYTKLLRHIEKILLRNVQFEGAHALSEKPSTRQ
ncbi:MULTISPECIES: YqeG family HAD IIIA-type phosphatase [Atopobiaceae]|uniref:YqeG family HAD IIIA-type phosphatase n=1 Tax=Atopobiaceae TaxID=1643824 RepID=UPI00034E2530|nr:MULTISPECIES: YqeG family HAD IIIA-type phosphatase [Atopobiaceae]EPD78259.1 HAD phosphatase, family IIIA [Atopobium sp. oral taxon 199 str. F0494]